MNQDIHTHTHTHSHTHTHTYKGEETPLALNVLDFAEARANELHNMTKALEAKPVEAGKRVFQQLPRHMRRRAMSHNVRRLPRRLKEKAIREVGGV